MVLLSRILLGGLVDGRGRRARLSDLAVDLGAGDYPPVTRVLYRGPDHQERCLPAEAVSLPVAAQDALTTENLGAGEPASPSDSERAVLLRRDILDGLVLDLEHRQAVRANDLWLRSDGKRLRLAGADISPWAVVRRLGRGALGRGDERHLLDWKHVEFLRGDPRAARRSADYHRRVADLPAPEIARLVDAVPYLHAAELVLLLPEALAADVLESMSGERQVQVFEELDDDRAVRLLELMAPDLAADLLAQLEPGIAQRHVSRLASPQRERVVDLLRYPHDVAGGIMTNDIITIPARFTVGQARAALRERLLEPDFVYYLYVVDDEQRQRLAGVLTLRDMLVADDARRLTEIMRRDVITVDPLEPASAAARRVAENHFAALPVVARDGRLLGAITVDAAVDQLAPSSLRTQMPRLFS